MEHDFSETAHEIWAAAQLFPGEGIEDGADRIEIILKETFGEEAPENTTKPGTFCNREKGHKGEL